MTSRHWRQWTAVAIVMVIGLILAACATTKVVTKDVPKEQGVTIILSLSDPNAAVEATPKDAKASKLPDQLWQEMGNHLRWFNSSSSEITIKFPEADWKNLFVEPFEATIVVPAQTRSAWYTIRENAPSGVAIPYQTSGPGGPPGEPTVTAGP